MKPDRASAVAEARKIAETMMAEDFSYKVASENQSFHFFDRKFCKERLTFESAK